MLSDSRRLEKPRALLPACIPTPGGIWADFGCGDGVFSTILQHVIGPEGHVVAVDLRANELERLRRRFARDHPHIVVETVVADIGQRMALPELDGFVAANALHFIDSRQRGAVFEGLVSHLRAGGRAVVVEYNARRPSSAVPYPLDPEAFLALAAEARLEAAHIAARVPSTFLGEMYAGVAIRPTLDAGPQP